jgi:hypothetical protein
MKRKLFLVALSAMALGFSGCATILGGGNSQVVNLQTFDGKPAEATIGTASGTPQQVTLPASITVKRAKAPLTVNVKETATTNASSYTYPSKVNFWVIGNLLGYYFSTSSTTTDAISGSIWVYDETVLVPVTRK